MNPWLAILFFALAACHAAAEPSARAVLLEEKMFTLVANGKSVGECRVLKGATVTVLSVDGDKVLVSKSPISSAWVPKSALQMESPLPEPSPSPAPEPVPVSEKESGVLAKGKEAVGFLKGALKDISTSPLATDLAKKAGSFAAGDTAAPSPTAQPPTRKPVSAPDTEGSAPGMPALKGSALEVFLVDSLRKSWDDIPDAERVATRAVAALKISQSDLPQTVLSSLSGTALKNGKSKGSLQVSIDEEANHRDLPGFSNQDIEALTAALSSDGKTAVVEILKTDWTLENGMFRRERKLQKSGKETVLLSNYENDSFLCRKTKNGKSFEMGRLGIDDLRLGGTAFVTGTVEWQEESKDAITLPADFHYQKTLIIPGQFAFLALPFEKQEKGGICTAASALNIIQFIAPEAQLKQRELFALYNGGRSGASLTEVVAGLESVGFSGELIRTHDADKKALIAKIHASLDAGRPILVTIPGHALTMIGYNKSTGKLIAWDQRMMSASPQKDFPRGAVETSESSIQTRFDYVIFIRQVDKSLSIEDEKKLAEVFGTTKGIARHEIVNGNALDENMDKFMRHAAAPKINSLLRSGRIPIIQKGKSDFITVTAEAGGQWTTKSFPSGTDGSVNESALARLLADAGGVFYSLLK